MLIKTTLMCALVMSCTICLLTLYMTVRKIKEYGFSSNILSVCFSLILVATFSIMLTRVSEDNPYVLVDSHRDYVYFKDGKEISIDELRVGDYIYIIDDTAKVVEVRPYRLFGMGPALVQ